MFQISTTNHIDWLFNILFVYNSDLSHKFSEGILKRVIMAYDHRSFPLLVGITFRELMSTIFHAQDPRNRRVKWFAVNLSSTWSPPSPRDVHLAVSHSISQLCAWRESERRRKRRGREGRGWNYVLSFIFERAQLWTLYSSTCRLFSALACQRCIGLLAPPAPRKRKRTTGKQRNGGRRWRDFVGYWNLTRKRKERMEIAK